MSTEFGLGVVKIKTFYFFIKKETNFTLKWLPSPSSNKVKSSPRNKLVNPSRIRNSGEKVKKLLSVKLIPKSIVLGPRSDVPEARPGLQLYSPSQDGLRLRRFSARAVDQNYQFHAFPPGGVRGHIFLELPPSPVQPENALRRSAVCTVDWHWAYVNIYWASAVKTLLMGERWFDFELGLGWDW